MSDEPSPRAPGAPSTARVLVIGAGGIAAPLVIALTKGGVRRFAVCDDDRVERSNLHRQVLFGDEDVGTPKLDAFAKGLRRLHEGVEVELHRTRFLPANAPELLAGADVVVDATDNFASRFLIADACKLHQMPVVHAAAVRWTATVMASGPRGGPCYRCLFEDLPEGDAPDCATAGVLGPVCGVSGALGGELALRILSGGAGPSAYGFIFTFDGRTDRLRKVNVRAREDCPLCGAEPSVTRLDEARYLAPRCDLD